MNLARAHSNLLCTGLLCAAVALALGSPAVSAQEMDHSKMQMTMPMPAQKAPARKPAVKQPAMKKPALKKPAINKSTPAKKTQKAAAAAPAADDASMPEMDHSSMDHGSMAMPATQAAQPMDHSGMSMPADAGSMQGMDHSSMDHGSMPMASDQPREPIPELTAADRAAVFPPVAGHVVHDNTIQHYVLFDRLEAWNADHGTGLEWEGQAWIGTDLNRVWLRSEGERVDNRTESADLEVLYGHSITPWWDVVAGVRHDFKPGASQDFAVIGVIGLAPYKYEVEATAYIGPSGQTSARIQAEYDLLLSNRLILQSLLEVNLYGQDDPRRGIGAGLSTVETGYRLRYEFTRRFAPYIGIVQERAFGNTAALRRAEGKDTKDFRLVAGIRIWF